MLYDDYHFAAYFHQLRRQELKRVHGGYMPGHRRSRRHRQGPRFTPQKSTEAVANNPNEAVPSIPIPRVAETFLPDPPHLEKLRHDPYFRAGAVTLTILLLGIPLASSASDLVPSIRLSGLLELAAVLISLSATIMAWRGQYPPRKLYIALALILFAGQFWFAAQLIPVLIASKEASTQEASPQAAVPQSPPIDWQNEQISNRIYDGAHLEGSRISSSIVSDTSFGDAFLKESDFRGTTFTKVNFGGADLCGVDARGADFTGSVNLDSAHLWFLLFDEYTKFPSGIDPDAVVGPVPFIEGADMLYQCDGKSTRVLQASGDRR